ncbi:MAG: hypothetical protein V3T79_04785, partial [Candidatus Scalindua sediminis]
MEYQFTSPDFLKLLYILPAFWVTAIMGFRRLSFLRILLSIFLRTFVFLLVVFVLAGFSWNEKSKNEISAVFLLDMSGSINQEGKKWMWDYVRDVEKNLDKKTKKGLVVFGGESKVVTP